jgi:hypothetical protein
LADGIPVGSLVRIMTNSSDSNDQRVGLVVSFATPHSLSEISGNTVEEWLWRELNDQGRIIESAYIIKIGEFETVYSSSELSIVKSAKASQ